MKKQVGLWIDHRKAVMVTIENDVDVTREIRSNIEKQTPSSTKKASNAKNNTQRSTSAELRDRRYGDYLGRYYEAVISFIRNADSILIFGPGESKSELENNLRRAGLEERIVGIEAVAKMTNQQIVTKVRNHFVTY